MEDWLAEVFANSPLTEEDEGYLLGRGVKPQAIRDLQFGVWRTTGEPAPDTGVFKERYKADGRNLNGRLFYPLFCPRGLLQGFEARTFGDQEKRITRYMLPRAEWNPVWIGIMPQAVERILEGRTPWVSEGIFDMTALEHLLPEEPLLASLRARLTDQHIEFLRRFVAPGGTVTLVYDNDDTGEKGIKKARYRLRDAGLHCQPVPYTKGKDPGAVWEDFGTEGLRQAFGM